MTHRYTRAARGAIPVARAVHGVTRHHGDEFDQMQPTDGCLGLIPVRDYTPKVPQTFDEMATAVNSEPIGVVNQCGPIIDGAGLLTTDKKSLASYLAAFDKRTNSQPEDSDDCTPEFMAQALALWRSLGRRLTYEEFDVDEVTYNRWLAKMDPPKQARMSKAYAELFSVENDSAYLGKKTLSVKVEALLKRNDNKWAPRLIYAGSDHFNALTGPVAMIICERLVETFKEHRLGPIKYNVAYKTDDVALARHLVEARDAGYTHCLEADFSSNDLYQRKGMTTVTDTAIGVLGAPTWFRKLLIDMRCFTVVNHEFGHTAEVQNQLPTGTTMTTARNCIVNSTIESVYAQMTGNCGIANILGDDFLGMMLMATDTYHFSSWVSTDPKMKLKAISPELSGESTFLSRRICVETEVPCMMPKLGKALARFNARVSNNGAISDSAYMAGKALSYAYEFRHFPCFRDLFLMRYRSEEDKAHIDFTEISWFTRTSGIDQADQLLERIAAEKVVVSEDETREFMMDSYGYTFGLTAALEIARRIILCTDRDIVSAPSELNIDWE